MLRQWINIRNLVVPDSPYLFSTIKGEKLSHLGRLVNAIAEKVGISLPVIQTVRPVVEIKASSLPDDKKTSVARSLSHSSITAEKHYRALEKEKIIEGYGAFLKIKQSLHLL